MYGFKGVIDYESGHNIKMTVAKQDVILPFVFSVGTNPFVARPSLLSLEDVVLGPNMVKDINVCMSAAHKASFHNQMLEFSTTPDVSYLCQNAVLPVHKDQSLLLRLQLANPSRKAIIIPKGTVVAFGQAVDLDNIQAFIPMGDDDAVDADSLANMSSLPPSAPSVPSAPTFDKAAKQDIEDRWKRCIEVQDIDLSKLDNVSGDIVLDLKRRILEESDLFVQTRKERPSDRRLSCWRKWSSRS